MNKFINLIHGQGADNWSERAKGAFEELFGAGGGRYPDKGKKVVTLRAPEFRGGSGVSFAAMIHPSNPDSGAYGGMSLVVFPAENARCMLAMVVGTQGLSPDEEVLGRPGHGRKVAAICSWLNQKHGKGNMVAWAKQDPVRTDLDVPENVKRFILFRIKALLDSLDRRFEYTESFLKAPRGTVNWSQYSTSCVPSARFLQVPCRYPDLRDDRELKAAIHYTLLKQLKSLESQRTAGIVVLQLINLCQLLLERVRNVEPKLPSSMALGRVKL